MDTTTDPRTGTATDVATDTVEPFTVGVSDDDLQDLHRQAYRQMVAQGASGGGHGEAPAGPPSGVAVFAADNTIRSVMDPGGHIDHWSEFDRGGHFPAMEVPDLLVDDIRLMFRGLRGG